MYSEESKSQLETISVIQGLQMIRKGDEGFLCFVTTEEVKHKPSLQETPIVQEYFDDLIFICFLKILLFYL